MIRAFLKAVLQLIAALLSVRESDLTWRAKKSGDFLDLGCPTTQSQKFDNSLSVVITTSRNRIGSTLGEVALSESHDKAWQ